MNLIGILVFVLTAVLMYLYHKLFTVIYTNPIYGILREIVICFGLSIVILAIICQIFGIDIKGKDTEADRPPTPSQTQNTHQVPSATQDQNIWQESSITQEVPMEINLPVEDFYGDFYNTALLNGSIFDAWLTIEQSGSSDGRLHIEGNSCARGLLYEQIFDVTILCESVPEIV